MKSVDPKVYELAQYFAPSNFAPMDIQELAERIQQAVEDFVGDEG